MPHYVYILRCSDRSLYVGITGDLSARVATHNAGRGGSYTSTRLPVELAYSEAYEKLESAIAREKQLKRWTAAKKEALIAGDALRLRRLSRSRST